MLSSFYRENVHLSRPNGSQSTGGGRQRSVPEMPAALLSSLFRHTGVNTISAAGSTSVCASSGSCGQEENGTSVVKPLSHTKPVDSVVSQLSGLCVFRCCCYSRLSSLLSKDRSYAHFLVPRKPQEQTSADQRFRRRAETVAIDEIPTRSDTVPNRCEYRNRLHTMSLSNVAGPLSG